jgi:hypothetical protein
VARHRLPGRLATTVLAVAIVIGLASSAALAAWSASASGQRQVAATTVNPPASVTASAADWSSTTISWQQPAAGAPPSTYRVVRVPATVVCEQATPPCTDSGLVGSTSYTYDVYSRIGSSWVSATAARATTTTPVGPSYNVTAAASTAAGSALTVTIQAKTSTGADDTSVSGARTIAWSGTAAQDSPNGTAATLPTSVSFNRFGRTTVSVTLTSAGTGTLTLSDAQGRNGSVTITTTPGSGALTLACPASGKRSTDVSITVSRATTDAFGNATPDATVTLTAGSGTWPPTGLATRDVTLSAAAPSSSPMLTISTGTGSTTVSTNAPVGYTAATTCSILKTN